MVSPSQTERFTVSKLLTLALWLGAWSLFVAASCAPPIQYVYDDNARLIAVVDGSQAQPNARVYHYDGAGNVTSIEARDSSQVWVLDFAPPCGSAGAAVTIYGTGFTSTSTVTFNGISAASVTYVSATQLTAVVPGGNATGPIAVSGVTNSSLPSFRADACGAPTISDVTTGTGVSCATKPIGIPGTPVTLIGTNFSTDPTQDRVLFNNHAAAVGPPNPQAQQLYTAVPPSGTSGKISVRTSAASGSATSPCDFFVPPPGYTVAQVDLANAQRMSNPSNAGQSGSVTVGSDSLVGLTLFDETAGRQACLSIDYSMYPCGGSPTLALYDGNASTLWSLQPGGFIDAFPLTTTGTYALLLKPASGCPGTLKVTMYDVDPDIHSNNLVTMTAISSFTNVGSFPIAMTSACQNTQIAYQGTGRRLSLLAWYVQLSAGYGLNILDAQGTSLVGGSPYGYLATPATVPGGVYTAVFDPSGTARGSATLYVYDFLDNTGPITPGTTQTGVTIDASGQNVFRTFTAGASGSVTVTRTNVNKVFACGTGFRSIALLDANNNPVPNGGTYDDTLGPIAVTPGARYTVRLNLDLFSCSTGSFDLLVTSS